MFSRNYNINFPFLFLDFIESNIQQYKGVSMYNTTVCLLFCFVMGADTFQ